MPNIVITSKGTNGIYVDFGDYVGKQTPIGILRSPQGYNACYVENIEPEVKDGDNGVRVVYEGTDRQKWNLTHDENYSGDHFMIVDTIDGAAPSSQNDLIDKITALL